MDGRSDSPLLYEPVRKALKSSAAFLNETRPLKALLRGLGHRKERRRVTESEGIVCCCRDDCLPELKGALLDGMEALMKERKRWRAREVERLTAEAEAEAEGRELRNGLPYSEERFGLMTRVLRNFLKHYPPERITVWKPLPGQDPDEAAMGQKEVSASRHPAERPRRPPRGGAFPVGAVGRKAG
jgi:hypothetical protein